MSTLVIGSHYETTAEYYKKIGLTPSILITSTEQIFDVGHTSIQDMYDFQSLEQVAKNVENIYWAECNVEEFGTLDNYIDFIFWLKDFNRRYNTVRNFESVVIDPYQINSVYNPTADHAVFFGCSYTTGTGLSDHDTHYSTLLSNRYKKQVYNLSRPGGSNDLIFNRFVNTQWNPGQIAVVQLTFPFRLYYCNENYKKYNVILSNNNDNAGLKNKIINRSLVEVYQKPWIFSQLLDKITAIDQIAKQNNLKMALWLIDYKNPELYSVYDQTYFYHMKSFVPASLMQNYLVDSAEDNVHPGVQSNRIIADVLHKFISEVY
jgi:hypothetical protein